MESQLAEGRVPQSGGEATRYFWYEVRDRGDGTLGVSRVADPPGAGLMNFSFAVWFGLMLSFGCWGSFLWIVLPLWLLVGCMFYFGARTMGFGEEEWRVEPDLLVVTHHFLGRTREQRFAGATLEIVEKRSPDLHTLELRIVAGKTRSNLFLVAGPSEQQASEMAELGRRLAETTGWRLVSRS